MDNVDNEWEQFLLQFNEFASVSAPSSSTFTANQNTGEEHPLPKELKEPKDELGLGGEYIRNQCEDLYISTQTKIFYLNVNYLDVDKIFWNLSIMDYGIPKIGIIKKQMRMIFKCQEEYEIYATKIKEIPYYTEKIIKQINNPNARKIKFKDERKITVGISKKDIMNCHGKEKKAFINCFAMILRMQSTVKENHFHEVHVKVFNTGKITIPGIVDNDDNLLEITKKYIIDILQPNISTPIHLISEEEIPLLKKVVRNKKGESFIETTVIQEPISSRPETILTAKLPKNSHYEYFKQQSGVLINSNFNCGVYIDQMKLIEILQDKYNLEPTYNKSNYPGVKCKFYLNNELPLDISVQTGRVEEKDKNMKVYELKNDAKYTKITFVIFRTGNNLILGNFSKKILLFIFDFVKNILLSEYENIRTIQEEPLNKKQKKIKPRKKKMYFTKSFAIQNFV
jgi:hypothetical protein